MANDKEIWKLDLDSAEFLEKAKAAKGAIELIGTAKSLEGLVESIGKTTKVLGGMALAAGAVTGSVLAMKEAMDLVFEAESIKAINQQFEILTTNAGIATNTLHEGLVRASNGLIDDTELLKIANKAIIDMGASAAQLPELLETARKATALMGGDLAQNFDAITRAINTGSLRALKQLGLDLRDTDKIYQDYAKSIGVATAALNDNGKRHALLNAVIDKGRTAYKGVTSDAKEATTIWQQTKVLVAQVAETFTLAFDKTFGPVVKEYLAGLKRMAEGANVWAKAKFGEGVEKDTAQIALLTNEIGGLQKELDGLVNRTSPAAFQMQKYGGTVDVVSSAIERLKIRIEELTTQKQLLEDAVAPLEEGEGMDIAARMGGAAPKKEAPSVHRKETDTDEQLKIETKLQGEIIALRMKTSKEFVQTTDNEEAAVAELYSQRQLIEAEYGNKKAELLLLEQRTGVSQAEKIKEIDAQMHLELQAHEDQTRAAREAALDRYLARSQSTAEGISRGFAVGSKKAALELGDFGKRGAAAFNSVGKNASTAFKAIGADASHAGQHLKAMFLNVLADRAEGEGELLLLSGLWPPNPVSLAAGAGLLALSGLLRSKAGGGSSGGIGGGGGGGGGGGPESGYKAGELSAAERPEIAPEAYKRREVTVQIQGNYIEHPAMQEWLVDQIRKETDATAFKYQQIGED